LTPEVYAIDRAPAAPGRDCGVDRGGVAGHARAHAIGADDEHLAGARERSPQRARLVEVAVANLCARCAAVGQRVG
jgi:hypothetical protein